MGLVKFAFLMWLLAPLFSFAASDCDLALRQKVAANLGYTPDIEIKSWKAFVDGHFAERHLISAKHPMFGMYIGFVDYTILASGESAQLDKIDILNDNNFRKGISQWLFSQMIENSPQLKRIRFSLGQAEERELNLYMAHSKDKIEAFKQTPLFKIAARFGFTKISDDSNSDIYNHTFLMEFEPPH